jgi:hypothetical protein
MERLAAITALSTIAAAVPLLAFGGRVSGVRVNGPRVHASIQIEEPFGTTQRAILERGGTLHVRVEAGVWEDRAVFDRAVESAHVATFRVIRNPNGSAVAVVDPRGTLSTYKPYPEHLTLDVDTCGLDQLDPDAKYYVDGTVTIGSLGEDELDEASEAVFGRDDDPAGLKRVGKFLLNSVLQVKDYVDSVSTEVRSGRFTKNKLKP